MRLQGKLALTSMVLILAMLVSAGTAHLRVREATQRAQDITANRMPLLRDSFELRTHVANSIRALQSQLLFGDRQAAATRYPIERAQEMEKAEASLSRIESAQSQLGSSEDLSRLKHVRSQLTSLRSLQESAEHQTDAKAADEAFANSRQILDVSEQLSDSIDGITESQELQAEREAQSLEHANLSTLWTLWLAVIASCILGGAFTTFVGRNVIHALEQVADRANAIAAGDLTGSPLMLQRNDEIGSLAQAMNRMQSALGGIIGTVADTAGSLTGSAATMRESSEHIHQRMDEQSQQTQQAATAMQEMSASIAEVSRHTQSAAETAKSAVQTARDGGTIVKEVLGSMRSIATSASDVGSTMGVLGEDSRRISQVVTVIDEIARKTNLLALNAAIEAARAGDQGRGFAVVAAEVRRLAESTAQATSEIATMISGIQARTRTAIANMEQGSRLVEQGAANTTQAGEALERIIGMAERVDRMITQIAIAAAQQAMAADQSSASLDSIHSLSNENVREMATAAAGIETLRGTAVTLERQVDRFQVVAA